MKKNIWALLILSLLFLPAFGQDQTDSSKRTKPKITPFLVPVYAPEVKLIFVAGGVFTFQTGFDHDTKRSSLPFNLGWSTNNSKELDFRPVIYGRKNNTRFFGRLFLQDMPDHYFGVGYDKARFTEQSDTTTSYHRTWWQFDFNLVKRIQGNLFTGIRLDFNKTRAKDLNDKMMQDEWVIEDGNDIQNSGIGLILQYDSRDFEVNAKKGLLLNFNVTFYGNPLKSDYPFRIYILDYRHFNTIGHGKVLSWEIRTDFGSGEVPWTELPKLGSAFDLRGYRKGRYRHKTTGFGLLEYRHTFLKSKSKTDQPELSRHGVVLWVGTGSLGEKLNEWNKWLPNFGIGYRFEVQPSINARLDFGFGIKSSGFYINFNEAF